MGGTTTQSPSGGGYNMLGGKGPSPMGSSSYGMSSLMQPERPSSAGLPDIASGTGAGRLAGTVTPSAPMGGGYNMSGGKGPSPMNAAPPPAPLGAINQPFMPFLGSPTGQPLAIQPSAATPAMAPPAAAPQLPAVVNALASQLNPQTLADYQLKPPPPNYYNYNFDNFYADGGSVPRDSRDVIRNALRVLYPRG